MSTSVPKTLQSTIASRFKPAVGPAFGSIVLRRINPKRAVQPVSHQAKEEVLLGSLPARMIPKSGIRFSDQDHAH
jgi:hypothetical protein